MTDPRTPSPDPGRSRADAERIVNEVLDARAAGAEISALETLHDAARRDPSVLSLLRDVEESLHALRRTPRAADLSRPILARVARRRPFLARRARRRISATRIALACGALATLALVALVQRFAPDAPLFPQEPRPVSSLVEASRADAAESVRQIASAVGSLGSGVVSPVGEVSARAAGHPRRPAPLSLGNTTAYDSPLNWTPTAITSAPHHHRGPFLAPRSLLAAAPPQDGALAGSLPAQARPSLLAPTLSAASLQFAPDPLSDGMRRTLLAEDEAFGFRSPTSISDPFWIPGLDPARRPARP